MNKRELEKIEYLYYEMEYEKYLEKILTVDKKYWDIEKIGISFNHLKRYEETIKYMTMVKDDNSLYYGILGEAYYKIKNYDNAIKYLEIYLEKDAGSSYPWYELCMSLKKKYKKYSDFKNAALKYKELANNETAYQYFVKEHNLINNSLPKDMRKNIDEKTMRENYRAFINSEWDNYFGKEIKKMEDKAAGKTKPKSISKPFDKEYVLLKDMINDEYYPKNLVEKIKEKIKKLISFLEEKERGISEVQTKLDSLVRYINNLAEKFDEEDSEIETVARDSIGETIEYILKYFNVDIDIEEAIRERDW